MKLFNKRKRDLYSSELNMEEKLIVVIFAIAVAALTIITLKHVWKEKSYTTTILWLTISWAVTYTMGFIVIPFSEKFLKRLIKYAFNNRKL